MNDNQLIEAIRERATRHELRNDFAKRFGPEVSAARSFTRGLKTGFRASRFGGGSSKKSSESCKTRRPSYLKAFQLRPGPWARPMFDADSL